MNPASKIVIDSLYAPCISYWAVCKLQGPLLATLTLLLKLEPNVWEPIAPMAASGAKRVVREIGGAPALCELMVQLLERCAEYFQNVFWYIWYIIVIHILYITGKW